MSYLAEVEMPAPAVPTPQVDDLEYREDIDISELSDERDDEGVEEELSPLPPPPQKKEKLKTEDIFKPKQAPPKKEKVETTDEPIIPKIAPVKEKKKRQMSEKQLEALAKGREARAAKKAQKQTTPAAAPAPAPPPAPPAPAPAPPPPSYSKEDLEQLVFQGVQKYDTLRKERKAKKRETQAQQQHDNKVFSQINSALHRTHDPWAGVFNF
jgi:hypothetical protein